MFLFYWNISCNFVTRVLSVDIDISLCDNSLNFVDKALISKTSKDRISVSCWLANYWPIIFSFKDLLLNLSVIDEPAAKPE